MSQNGQQQEAETKVARWIQSSLISFKTSYFVIHIFWKEGCCWTWNCSGDPALYYTTFTLILQSIRFVKAGKLATKRRLTFSFLISRRRVCLSVLFRVFFSALHPEDVKACFEKLQSLSIGHIFYLGADDETSQERDISHLLHLCWKMHMQNASGYFLKYFLSTDSWHRLNSARELLEHIQIEK